MCDGQGRQFTNICPNATLFQQRMLICDHWYMVNCDKAESNYDANLLIGGLVQRVAVETIPNNACVDFFLNKIFG